MTPEFADVGGPPLPTHLLSGAWRVVRLIGGGELGEVYEVEHAKTNEVAAIKLYYSRYLPEAWRGLEQTARNAAELSSRVCVRPLEFGYEPTVHRRYALTEKVDAPSLHDLVQSHGKLDAVLLAELIQRLGSVLEVAHASGLIHRNLKPSNIFFDVNTRAIKLTDFGTSALQCSTPIRAGWAMSPGWAAPEGLDPREPSAPSMDVYALGLIAFFALTGRSPYRSLQAPTLDLGALRMELQAPLGSLELRAREVGSIISRDLAEWLMLSLATHPGKRFPSPAEQAEAFRNLSASGVHVTPHVRNKPAAPPARVLSAPSIVPPPPYDAPERAVALATAQPIALMPSLPPPIQAPPPTRVEPEKHPNWEDARERETPAALTAPIRPAASAPGSLWEGRLFVAVLSTGAISVCGIALMVWLFMVQPASPPEPQLPRLARNELKPPQSVPASAPAKASSSPTPAPSDTEILSQGSLATTPSETLRATGVRFRCEPEGCDSVYCDGQAMPVEDAPLPLTPGPHTCKAMKSGYRTVSQTFLVVAGENQERTFIQNARSTDDPPTPPEASPPIPQPNREPHFAAP